jgi:dTDP-4-amino-4,6-dideoxygalactose transaminase
MADALAAYLLAQLEAADKILAKRKRLFERYSELLEPHAGRLGLRLPGFPADRDPAYHMYHLLVPSRSARDSVLNELHTSGIVATFHYVPLHSSLMGQKVAARPTECPITDDISGRLLRLPFYNDLSPQLLGFIVDRLVAALERVPA